MISTAADLLADISDSLAAVLPEQRWFAGKHRPVRAVIPVRATDLAGCSSRLSRVPSYFADREGFLCRMY